MKIISSLTLSILTLMNSHIVHLPVLQSLASQIGMCAPRKAKWLTNDYKINRFWVLNPGQKVIARILVLDGTALDVVEVVEVDVLEDDAIFDRRPEGPSRWAISVVAWGESQSLRYAQGHLCRLPGHIWPWALAETSIFSKNNTEIKNKLNYSRAMIGFFVFNA